MKKKYILPAIHVKVIELNHIIAESPQSEYEKAAGDSGATVPTTPEGGGTSPSGTVGAKDGFISFGFDE